MRQILPRGTYYHGVYIMPERDLLLEEREKTHGRFEENARIFNNLKTVTADSMSLLTPEQYLATIMIYYKLSRAFQHPEVKDHWDDIAGYAKLASEAIKGKMEGSKG